MSYPHLLAKASPCPGARQNRLALDLRILRCRSRRFSVYRLARLLLDVLNRSRFAIRSSSCCPPWGQLGAGAGLPRLTWNPSIEVLLEGGWSIGISIIKPANRLNVADPLPEPSCRSSATKDTV